MISVGSNGNTYMFAVSKPGLSVVAVFKLRRDRNDLLVHEVPDRGQDLLLDVGETVGLGESCEMRIHITEAAPDHTYFTLNGAAFRLLMVG